MSDFAETSAVSNPSDFYIFTAGMIPDATTYADRPIVRMVGSSTEQDLHKDTMTVSALQDMVNVPNGLLIWLNHDYSVPDSLFGSLVEQPMLLSKSGFTDLHLAVEVELENPAAAKTYRYIQKKRRLGCSIGCSVEGYEVVDGKGLNDEPTQLIHITHVRPVEWSVVGVPSNQRSWVENAAWGVFTKSLYNGKEDAFKLAPIVRSLFPTRYNELAEKIGGDIQKSLSSVKPRQTTPQRILWEPETQKFFITTGNERRLWNEMPRPASATDMLKSAGVVPQPVTFDTSATNTTASASGTFTATSASNTTTVRFEGGKVLMNGVETPIIFSTTPPTTGAGDVVWIDSSKLDSTPITVTTKDGAGVLDTTSGEPMVRQDLEDKSADGERDAAKQAQAARAKQYGIGVKEGGNVTKPGEWSSVPDAEWGDPTNYRYPMPDKTHADNAASRWGDDSNRSQYSSEEQAIIGRRISARQAHFGESKTDEKKSVKNIVSQETLEGGAVLVKYDNGSEEMHKSVVREDGSVDIEVIEVKAAKKPEAKPEEKPADDEKPGDKPADGEPDNDGDEDDDIEKKGMVKCGECGHMNQPDAVKCASCDAPMKAAEKSVEPEGEVESVVEQKAADDKKPADDEKPEEKPEDNKEGKTSDKPAGDDSDAAEDNRFVGPPLIPEEEDTGEKKPAKGKKSGDEFLLKLYNDMGEKLGFAARSFDEPETLAPVAVDESMLKSLDESIEKMLLIFGFTALETRAGAEISANNRKRLQMVHDMVADFSRGMHCAEYVKKVSDAPAQMADQEKGVDGEAVTTKSLTPVTINFDTDKLDAFGTQLESLTKGLEALKEFSGVKGELETVKSELVLSRKSLGELQAQAAEIRDNIETYGSVPTGRPTLKSRESDPTRAAVDINGQTTTVTTKSATTASEATTVDEALALTTIEYVPGVGQCRRWPAGVGKGFRPSLVTDQMAIMDTKSILGYYDGGEVLVPVLRSLDGKIVG